MREDLIQLITGLTLHLINKEKSEGEKTEKQSSINSDPTLENEIFDLEWYELMKKAKYSRATTSLAHLQIGQFSHPKD